MLLAVAVLTAVTYFGRLQSLAYLAVDHCVLAGLDRVSVERGFIVKNDDPDPDARESFEFDGSTQGGIRASLVGDGVRCKIESNVGGWFSNGAALPDDFSIGDKWPVGSANIPPWKLLEYVGDTESVALIYPAGSPRQADIIAVNKNSGETSYAQFREALSMPFGLDGMLAYMPRLLVAVFFLSAFSLMVLHVYGYYSED